MKLFFLVLQRFVSTRSRRVCALTLAIGSLEVSVHGADVMPSPKLDPGLIGNHKREIVLQLKFGSDGKVIGCDVIKESGLPKLDKAAVIFIRRNWMVPSESGHTARIPIDFEPPKPVAQSKPKTEKPAPPPSTTQTGSASALSGAGGGGGGGFSSTNHGAH